MRRKRRCSPAGFIILFIIIITCSLNAQNTVRINEFLASNQTVLPLDEDNEYSDWIEIYNPTASDVNLQGWTLTDDINDPFKWVFPDVTIESDGYLIVFASGKDRNVSGNELHTNFKLDGGGEFLALINADLVPMTFFQPKYPGQLTDISYGYYNGTYISFTPTPEERNDQTGASILPPPAFNIAHGFFESPFSLVMNTELPGAQIYYTTDGSLPSETNGTLYSGPVSINTTSVIRAVSSIPGENPSRATTQTYLFLDDIIQQSNNPAGYPDKWGPYTALGSDTAIADYEMDPEMMADSVFASSVVEALKDIPTISLVTDKNHLFSHTEDPDSGGIYIYTGPPLSNTVNGVGDGWERPVSFEYFDPNDSLSSLQIDCGIRLQGGHSRRPEKSPKHSFRLVFRSNYGPSKLNFPLFGEEAASKFNTIPLRAGFCNTWIHHEQDQRTRAQYIRDAWGKDAQLAMGHLACHGKFVHLYINGIYWGLYNPTERIDKDFAASYLEGGEDDFDVIKDYTEVVDGSVNAWNAMMLMANTGLQSAEAYQRIQGNNPDGSPNYEYENYLDVVNLTDYMLINMYGGNTDWDHHNWAAIRNRIKPGKGFKFICWDEEHILKSLSENVTDKNNDNCPSRLFQQLRQNGDYLKLFSDRVQRYCFNDGILTPNEAAEIFRNRSQQIENAVLAESARWGDYRRDVHPYQTAGPFELYTKEDHWIPQQQFMFDTYFPGRTDAFLTQLRNGGLFPNAEAPQITLNGTPVIDIKNIVSLSDEVSMSVSEGTIYYTTDGSDPVVWASSQGYSELTLVEQSAIKKAFVPTSDIGNSWFTDLGYDDSGWLTGPATPGGVGYENSSGYESLVSIDVGSLMTDGGSNPNPSCYVRIPFSITAGDLTDLTTLLLNVRYDDGFVAYLNGQKVAEFFAPASPVWNSESTGSHEADAYETFNISEHLDLIVEGNNLLAIHGLNRNTSSSDFLIMAELVATDQPASGNISPGAIAYSGTFTIDKSEHIKARTFYNNEWSALTDRYFIIPADYHNLRITEIHYHPLDSLTVDDSKFEFIEIKNTGNSILNLGGLQFIKGVEYIFPEETELKPGEFKVIASNDNYFLDRYGFMPDGDFKGQLDNNGEKIVLANGSDTICMVRYYDINGWPVNADGIGNSLVPTEINPNSNQSLASNWRSSYYVHGSPGEDDLVDPGNPPDTNNIDTLDPDFIINPALEQTISLSQNYPNPFSNITYIDYYIPADAEVNLSIFNMMGQQVCILVNRHQVAGFYQEEWNGNNIQGIAMKNGIYFYRIEIQSSRGSEVVTKKMVLQR